MPYYTKEPKQDHDFDNHPYYESVSISTSISMSSLDNFDNHPDYESVSISTSISISVQYGLLKRDHNFDNYPCAYSDKAGTSWREPAEKDPWRSLLRGGLEVQLVSYGPYLDALWGLSK